MKGKRKLNKPLLTIGLVLLGLSAKPLFNMAYESYYLNRASSRYKVTDEHDKWAVSFREHVVEVSDAQEYDDEADPVKDRVSAPVFIHVNGKDYSTPHVTSIRIGATNANRLHHYVNLLEVTDTDTEESKYAVVQRISDNPAELPADEEWNVRIVWVAEDGEVSVSQHTKRQTKEDDLLWMVSNGINPVGEGYKNNSYWVWPSLFYPILFPWISGPVGLLLSLLGWFWHGKQTVVTSQK